MDSFMIY